RGEARRGAHPGGSQPARHRARAARAGERDPRDAARGGRALVGARHRARGRRPGRGEPAHSPAAVQRRPRHQRGRARRPAPADAAARHPRRRPLPGPHATCRAPAADGPAARGPRDRHEVAMFKRIPILLVLLVAVGVAVWWFRTDHGPPHYTGFVEGEERVIRSEVSGRVLEVPYREGATVPPGAIVAKLDDRDIAARVAAKRAEVDSIDAQI